jgi:FtsH-binding integral membrane protein
MSRPRQRTGKSLPIWRQPLASRTARGAWWAVIMGALLIIGLGWLISLQPENSQFLVATSLLFALAEGVILAFVAALWSSRGLPYAVAASVLTGAIAAAGRSELVYVQNSRTAQMQDLLLDLGFTLAYAVIAGIIGATILRERLPRALVGS